MLTPLVLFIYSSLHVRTKWCVNQEKVLGTRLKSLFVIQLFDNLSDAKQDAGMY